MSTAHEILEKIKGAQAVSLEAGYAVFADYHRALFEPCYVLLKSETNGRCTHLHARYKDGSRLHYNWHPSKSASYRAFNG